MGCIAELLGVYIILAAGAKVLPESLRFVRYKLWMRIALAIWWLALLLGLTTYARWYVVLQHFSSTGSKAPAHTIGSATNPTASGISRLSAMASSSMYTPASLFEPGALKINPAIVLNADSTAWRAPGPKAYRTKGMELPA
jgi:hypothetical protein